MTRDMEFIRGEFNTGYATTEKCPDCGKQIVYNGNYFCIDWGSNSATDGSRMGGPCNWALPHPVVEPRDKEITARLGLSKYDNFE